MTDSTRYWFPAKRYGWGWSLPTTWQGWLVLAAVGAAEIALAAHLMPREPMMISLGSVAVVLLLLVICYVKGEPPSWRWGDRNS
jgi:hypothetical protein